MADYPTPKVGPRTYAGYPTRAAETPTPARFRLDPARTAAKTVTPRLDALIADLAALSIDVPKAVAEGLARFYELREQARQELPDLTADRQQLAASLAAGKLRPGTAAQKLRDLPTDGNADESRRLWRETMTDAARKSYIAAERACFDAAADLYAQLQRVAAEAVTRQRKDNRPDPEAEAAFTRAHDLAATLRRYGWVDDLAGATRDEYALARPDLAHLVRLDRFRTATRPDPGWAVVLEGERKLENGNAIAFHAIRGIKLTFQELAAEPAFGLALYTAGQAATHINRIVAGQTRERP